MPASRTTRTTSNPTTPPDSTPLDSTAPDTPEVTVPGSAAPHVAATSNPAVDDTHDPNNPSKATTTATDPDGKASRPRRRTPRTATTAGASDTTTNNATPSDATPSDAPADAPGAPAVAGAPDTTGETEGGSPIEDDVWAALRKQPGATATELARSVPASRKIVLAMLNRWCAEGSVDTTPGATARAAARYFALPSTLPTPPPASVPPADIEHEPTAPVPATTTAVGETPDAEPNVEPGSDAEPGAPDAVTASSAEAVTGRQPTAQTVPDVPTAGTDADRTEGARINSSGSVRLGSGALHGMVEDFLREHAAGEHGPVAIAKSIGRSSGAVANALERMVGSGWAVRTSDKPKRYRIADGDTAVTTTTADTGTDQVGGAVTGRAESDAVAPDAAAPVAGSGESSGGKGGRAGRSRRSGRAKASASPDNAATST